MLSVETMDEHLRRWEFDAPSYAQLLANQPSLIDQVIVALDEADANEEEHCIMH